MQTPPWIKSALAALALLCLFSAPCGAETPGQIGMSEVKQCLMQNDVAYCHSVITPDSYPLFDRFVSYKLMPCLPTDFVYESEETVGARTTTRASINAGGGKSYFFRMVFDATPAGLKVNVPESLHTGFGDKWENKIQLAEQLYLMMKQNIGDKLTCDMLTGLLKK